MIKTNLPWESLAVRFGACSNSVMRIRPCPCKAAQWHGVIPVVALAQLISALIIFLIKTEHITLALVQNHSQQ